MALNDESTRGKASSSMLLRSTRLLPVNAKKLPRELFELGKSGSLESWSADLQHASPDFQHLLLAAKSIQTSDVPVAFPTETVYGLGADARRSSAVRGIYEAKQRPSDNPLIVHVASLQQLRQLLRPADTSPSRSNGSSLNSGGTVNGYKDPIPSIYEPLIQRFWPGPLTIILPKPQDSVLAPEVTAGLNTFGARMPRNIIALALIKLADVPVAAPSANASTKPSPTAAEHVQEDLDGRIDYIVDGGPCEVGLESTVVDGLSDPPTILRPGGIGLDQLRSCPGWENVVNGYKQTLQNDVIPRAPGMKYRHYSPKAKVILYESGAALPTLPDILPHVGGRHSVGLIRTVSWPNACGLNVQELKSSDVDPAAETGFSSKQVDSESHQNGSIKLPEFNDAAESIHLGLSAEYQTPIPQQMALSLNSEGQMLDTWEINLGASSSRIARGLFSALRELDRRGVETIFVEGVADDGSDVAAAIMNRLRKASQTIVR